MLNLTPHAININGKIYEPSGVVARVIMEEKVVNTLNGITVISRFATGVEGIPEEGGTIIRYGVSKKGIIEQGRSIRVAKVKLKKQLKQTNK